MILALEYINIEVTLYQYLTITPVRNLDDFQTKIKYVD